MELFFKMSCTNKKSRAFSDQPVQLLWFHFTHFLLLIRQFALSLNVFLCSVYSDWHFISIFNLRYLLKSNLSFISAVFSSCILYGESQNTLVLLTMSCCWEFIWREIESFLLITPEKQTYVMFQVHTCYSLDDWCWSFIFKWMTVGVLW